MKKLLVLSLFILLGVFLVSCDNNKAPEKEETNNNDTSDTDTEEDISDYIIEYTIKADTFIRNSGLPSKEIKNAMEYVSYSYMSHFSKTKEDVEYYYELIIFDYERYIIQYCYENFIKIKAVFYHWQLNNSISRNTFNSCLDIDIYKGTSYEYEKERNELNSELVDIAVQITYAQAYGGNVAALKTKQLQMDKQYDALIASWANRTKYDKAYLSIIDELDNLRNSL